MQVVHKSKKIALCKNKVMDGWEKIKNKKHIFLCVAFILNENNKRVEGMSLWFAKSFTYSNGYENHMID